MTDDQKRRQRIELMLDQEKAEEDARALRNALKAKADSISVIAEWLDDSARSISVSKLANEFYSRKINAHVDVVEDARFREALDLDHLIALRQEFISSQLRFEELAARHRELKAAS